MGCGCKKLKKLDEKYGMKQEVNLFGKIIERSLKVFLFLLSVIIGLIIFPIILVLGLYGAFFRNGKGIMLPNFLTNKLKKTTDG